ncbi:Transaldolase [Micractinium conductrix]|uniref:Transaldolase n=1 Tax=Micractinium conductrix TaxID=554055 RepID=A0A2P6VAP6_9CHLO|nr:Transaldolase [Micractinium conductrix]|eukprot:PSC71121.1 Transaldolase [Micractinium conductrix]
MDEEEFEDTSMRLYLDSANVQEWEKWAEAGLFYGFTTNPTILKKDGVPCNIASMRHLTREAFTLDMEELQLQAWGTTGVELYSCGLDLMDLDSRVVVKLPITLEGAKAARRLIADGVPVTMTGVYAAHQVVTALAMGAAYAAPYVGRMTDAGKKGLEEAARMQKIVDLGSNEGGMRLLVASVRSAEEVAMLAAEGCNTFTISPAVAARLFDEPLTTAAAELFQEHADEMGAMRGH